MKFLVKIFFLACFLGAYSEANAVPHTIRPTPRGASLDCSDLDNGDNQSVCVAIQNHYNFPIFTIALDSGCTDNTYGRFGSLDRWAGPVPADKVIPSGYSLTARLGINSGDGCSLLSDSAKVRIDFYKYDPSLSWANQPFLGTTELMAHYKIGYGSNAYIPGGVTLPENFITFFEYDHGSAVIIPN